MNELNEENAVLKGQLELADSESQEKSHELQGVVKECEELEMEIARHNQMQTTVRDEAAALKKQATDLKDSVQTATWALEEAQTEEDRLRAQVVSSPDRRKHDLVSGRERLEKTRNECAELEEEIQSHKTKIVNCKQIEKDVSLTSAAMRDLQESVRESQELQAQLDEAKEENQESSKQETCLLHNIEETERELFRSEEKINHQREQHKMELDALQESLETAKSDILGAEKDRREGLARVEASEGKVRALEETIEQEKQACQQEIQAMVDEFKETERLFLERNAARMALMQQPMEA